jgi:hypothetical protein
MIEFKQKGGASIGTAHASSPYAVLTVTSERLDLNASLVGNLTFLKEDIISIKPYYTYFTEGIIIQHRVKTYKENVTFWMWGKKIEPLAEIEAIGFLEGKHSDIPGEEKAFILERQQQGGFPLQKWVPIAFGIQWNLFFIADFIKCWFDFPKPHILNYFALPATLIAFFACLGILYSEKVRQRILKKGRTREDVEKLINMVMFFGGGMSAVIILTEIYGY